MLAKIRVVVTPSPGNAPLLVRAARGEPVERVPVWLMRQAGRYLAEYRELRSRHGFLDAVKTPELAVELSLQPWRAFRPDGVILFSDILVPLAGMGLPFRLDEGGPRVERPVRHVADVEKLKVADPAESVPYVLEALGRLRREIAGQAAVLGFAGAPYTLAVYAVGEARHAKESAVKTLAFEDPATLHRLLAKLADQTASYLAAQAAAGADVVQLFDTWAGELSWRDYRELALPYQQRAIASVRGRVPVALFVLGGAHVLDLMAASGADLLSIDWRMPLGRARAALGSSVVLQGNLDPAVLLGGADTLRERTLEVLGEGKGTRHVFNLGHGVLPTTPRENVALLFETVKSWRR
jgi:uroporphyrinogen decarboxylase